MPPAAAMNGIAARRQPASSPATISRLISSPTMKKKTAMSASLTKCANEVEISAKPRFTPTGMCCSA